MVVHKSHPDGPALLAVFEKGLAEIRSNGTYQKIIDAHMSRVWAEF
jgi:polar amino acid transport system substrate-binding protein